MTQDDLQNYAALRAVNSQQATEIIRSNALIRTLKTELEARTKELEQAADRCAQLARWWKIAAYSFLAATIFYAVSFTMQVLK